MDENTLRAKVNDAILRHLNGIEEILTLDEVIKISKEQELNIVGLINALTTKLTLIYKDEYNKFNEEDISAITEFVDNICTEKEQHPIDTCFMLIKVLSDILLQICILEEEN